MAQIYTSASMVVILGVILVLAQVAQCAPTDSDPAATTTTTTMADATTTSTTPAPDSSDAASAATVPTPAASTMPGVNQTNFTCYGRQIGYYADMATDCKVYHFCVLGEYNGEAVYQRISYFCLNETVFDQQALDCVEKISAPCSDSEKYYDESNKVLRNAVLSNSTTTANSAAPSVAAN